MVIEEPRNTRNTRKIFSRVEHVDRVEGKAVLNAETQRRRVRREVFLLKGSGPSDTVVVTLKSSDPLPWSLPP